MDAVRKNLLSVDPFIVHTFKWCLGMSRPLQKEKGKEEAWRRGKRHS